MTLLTEALDRILNYLHKCQRQYPDFFQYWHLYSPEPRLCEFYPQLNPGLSAEEIAEITKDLPEPLPPEVIELYRWHNGSDIIHPYTSNWLFNFGEGWGWGRSSSLLDLRLAVGWYRDRRSSNLEDVTVDNLVISNWYNNTIALFDATECLQGYMVMNQSRNAYPIVFWDFKGGSDIVYAKYASLTDMMVTLAEYYESSQIVVNERFVTIEEDRDKFWEIWRKYNSNYWVELSLRNIDLMENKLPPYICDERLSQEIVRDAGDTWKFSQDLRLAEALSNFLKKPPIDDPNRVIDLKSIASLYLSYNGSLALDFLLPILKDPYWQNRHKAIWILGVIKDITSIPSLIDCLEDENENVRRQARIVLYRIQVGDGKLAEFLNNPSVAQLEAAYRSIGLDLYEVTGLTSRATDDYSIESPE